MHKMTDEEYRKFMLDTVRTGKLATVREDGRPHVVPIWYHMDGDSLIFMTGEDTVKGKNIKRDPRVAISVDEENPPFAFVLFEGEAEILNPTPDELLMWSTKIGGRYMGEDRAEEFGKRNAVDGELLIRVIPTKVIARGSVSD